MTDLALTAPSSGGVDLATAGRGVAAAADSSLVVEWAQRLAVVAKAVDMVIETPFVPASFWPLPPGQTSRDVKMPWLVQPGEDAESYGHRRRIATATASLAALHGERYGWSPEQSWRSLYVVGGRVSIGYEGVLALLRGMGFGVEIVERSATRAAMRLRRPGANWTDHEFTMADAEVAGYVPGKGPNAGTYKDGNPKKGGNEKYNTDPKTMLLARCVTIAARLEAPDVIAGMPVAEAMDDEPVESAREVAVTATPRTDGADVTAAAAETSADTLRAAIAASTPVPPAREEPAAPAAPEQPTPDDVDPDAGSDPASRPQLSKMSALLGEKFSIGGAGSRAERHRVIVAIVERPLQSATELTKAEASRVIDVLEQTTVDRFRDVFGQPTEPPVEPPASEPADEEPPIDPWGINAADGGQ